MSAGLDLMHVFFAYHDTTYMPVRPRRDEPQDVRGAENPGASW